MKYKVGDRVRIKDDIYKSVSRNKLGRMDCWQGKIMTIREVCEAKRCYKMHEDKDVKLWVGQAGLEDGWNWCDDMIEGLAEPTMTEIFRLAINTYGEDEQCRMIQEEMSELSVALSKFHRNPCAERFENAKEEIADVCIMMQQAKIMFGEADVDQIMQEKIDRLYDRLKDEQTVEVVAGKHKINGKTYIWINPDKVKVEIGGIAIADTKKWHTPIIVVSTWKEKLKDVKHHRKIVCAGGLSE